MPRDLAGLVEGRDHIPAKWRDDFDYARPSSFAPQPDCLLDRAGKDEHVTGIPPFPGRERSQCPPASDKSMSSERTHCNSAGTDISENVRTMIVLDRASNLLRGSLSVRCTAIFDAEISYTKLGSESELHTEPVIAAGLEMKLEVPGLDASVNAGGNYGAKDAPRRSKLKIKATCTGPSCQFLKRESRHRGVQCH